MRFVVFKNESCLVDIRSFVGDSCVVEERRMNSKRVG